MTVLATAGHVDHGKSTLVRALTGTDPDRLAEEQRRGLTIDLGFASTVLPGGAELSFVDVPGHVRFLKNMLAGVGAVDACVLVVAATEGWKPQSEEHLRILELLGVRRGQAVLTKAGLVDDDHLALTRLEVEDRLAGTFLEPAGLLAVDAVDGTGLDELRAALERLVTGQDAAPDRQRPRLWVDRSFAARGAGTVVTGTLTGGALSVDDELEVLPARRRVRVRGLQRHGNSLARTPPGTRVAVNLAGVSHDEVHRGDALVRSAQWHRTRTVDATLQVLAALDHPVSRRGAHLAYVGSGEHPVRVRVLGAHALEPGSHGLVRLHLPDPLPLVPGDRYVLRESGRSETVGGGEVLDVDPVLPAARARPDRSVDRVIAERGWVAPEDLERLTGERRAPTVGRWVASPEALAAERGRVADLVASAAPLGVDLAALDDRGRAVLALVDGVEVVGSRAMPTLADDPLAGHPYLAALEAEPFTPPPPDGVDRAELRELCRRGLVVERDDIWFAASALDRACDALAAILDERPEGVTVGEVRAALGTTRKFAVPLLGLLDDSGRTRRRGDRRIAGPRL